MILWEKHNFLLGISILIQQSWVPVWKPWQMDGRYIIVLFSVGSLHKEH